MYWGYSRNVEKGVQVFETFGGGVVNGWEVYEEVLSSSAGSEKEVSGEVEFGSNRKCMGAEKVHDECLDIVGIGDGKEGFVDIGIVEADEFKGEVFEVDRGVGRESNSGEIVKDDGGSGGRDGGYVWSSGTSVVRCWGDEYVDGE